MAEKGGNGPRQLTASVMNVRVNKRSVVMMGQVERSRLLIVDAERTLKSGGGHQRVAIG